MCLGFEPRTAGWWVQKDPLSYGCFPFNNIVCVTVVPSRQLTINKNAIDWSRTADHELCHNQPLPKEQNFFDFV